MAELQRLSVVALSQDLPAKGLKRGQAGTIVENLAPGVYEVEFSDDQGQTYASAALHTEQLMQLHNPANTRLSSCFISKVSPASNRETGLLSPNVRLGSEYDNIIDH